MQIVLDAVDKPRQINYKGAIDLVTNTDIASEEAVLQVGSARGGVVLHGHVRAYALNNASRWVLKVRLCWIGRPRRME